jgi:hypothetical protein
MFVCRVDILKNTGDFTPLQGCFDSLHLCFSFLQGSKAFLQGFNLTLKTPKTGRGNPRGCPNSPNQSSAFWVSSIIHCS